MYSDHWRCVLTDKELQLLNLLAPRCGYNPDAKRNFKPLARKLLRELDDITGLHADLRWNEGGIAVSGEATMHADEIYIQVSGGVCADMGILYRSCKGRKDFSGGRNRYYSWERLREYGVKGFGAHIAQVLTVPTDTDPDFEQAIEERRKFCAS
jgi:hypothetical protein